MDTHNTFDAPDTIRPLPYAGRREGGHVAFDLPPRSVAVVAVE
jgi:alpha-N-arabinofuranosidase